MIDITPESLLHVRETFVRFLKSFRKSHGVTLKTLSEISRVDQKTLRSIMDGGNGFSMRTMEKAVSNMIVWDRLIREMEEN